MKNNNENHTMKPLKILLIALLSPLFLNAAEPKIDYVELYLVNVNVERHFSYGTWKNRQHIIARIVAGEYEGWGEGIFAKNTPDFNPEKLDGQFRKILGKTPSRILRDYTNDRKMFKNHPAEIINMAMWDILGQVKKKPSAELLGLNGKSPVNGMFCILENEPEKIIEKAEIAKSQNLKNYIKMKAFGDTNLDVKLVSTLRKSAGDKCFIVADANCGYKNFKSIEELAATLKKLSDAGLNAIEDPAKLSDEDLIRLQLKCRKFKLSIIPDVNMRPSFRAYEKAKKDMGDFYNLHPGCMLDLYYMARLAEKIKSWNAGIMIGDDSLIGPACSIYQQLAIACGAQWVEALEKPQESGEFLSCIKEQAVFRTADGLYNLKPGTVGWGLKVDSKKLKEKAVRWTVVK